MSNSQTPSRPANMPKVGDVVVDSMPITDELVRDFARFSGDFNPVHLDDAYAAKTRFGARIAHGAISLALVSRVAGTKMPGPGSIYLSHNIRFKRAAYIGDTIVAEVKVTNVRNDKPIIGLSTIVRNQDGEVIVEGDAVILFEPPA